MREKEAKLLYEMNKRASITVITPCGETESFEVEKVVIQGTIYGPQLCCSSTSKIDEIGETRPETFISKELSIGTLVYVDDIGSGGFKTTIEEAGRNLREMERKKGFSFNTDKTKNMVVKTGKEQVEEVEIEVQMEKIEKVEKYKYLGNWMGENQKLTSQIKEKEKEAVIHRSK